MPTVALSRILNQELRRFWDSWGFENLSSNPYSTLQYA